MFVLRRGICVVAGVLHRAECVLCSVRAGAGHAGEVRGVGGSDGGSSGIGRALAERLLQQGVSVVLVALDDKSLRETTGALRERYGGGTVSVRSVGVDLTREADVYMGRIREATDDVVVTMVFANAGFVRMGYFEQVSVNTHAGQLECNMVSGVRIVHHFYSRMIERKVARGCICFTGSAACYLPSPFASMYGASKAAVANFATALAVEADQHNIDVTAVMPSYTHSENFYRNAPDLDALKVLSRFGWSTGSVADAILASVGRTVVRDIGAYATLTNVAGRVLHPGLMAFLMKPFGANMAPPKRS